MRNGADRRGNEHFHKPGIFQRQMQGTYAWKKWEMVRKGRCGKGEVEKEAREVSEGRGLQRFHETQKEARPSGR